MNKNLLTGLAATIVATLLQVVLPTLGINLDLSVFLDGEITVGDLLFVVGGFFISISQPVVNEMRKTTLGYKVFGAPRP